MTKNRVMMLSAFAGFVLLFSGATLLHWEFMRNTIFVPVYYVLWFSGLLLNSIPQGVYLALLVLGSVIAGAKIVQGTQTKAHTRRVVRNQEPSGTRYLYWRGLCAHAYGNPFSKNWFTLEARKLVVSVLAHEYGIDAAEAELLVKNGTLHVPDTLRAAFDNKYVPSAPLPSRFASAVFRLRQLLLGEKVQPDQHIERLMTDFVTFIESHLEINSHAGSTREP